MRDGPLAALFRKTTEDTEPIRPDVEAGAPPEESQTSRKPEPEPELAAPKPKPKPEREPRAVERGPEAERGPETERGPEAEPEPEPVAEPVAESPARREVEPSAAEIEEIAEPDPYAKMPTPQERLRQVFSSDIPMNLLDRMTVETAEPAPEPDVFARPERAGERPFATARTVGSPVLRVVGVGGAGVNAVNRMVEAEIEGVEFLAINTDLQSLQVSAAHETLHIGDGVTRGLGSGSNPDLGRRAAVEEHDRIKAMLRGSDMVFIAAGAGGGTGTGAAPVVAHISRELGALTVGIVTRPFQFEGTRRREQAEAGIAALAEEVDTLIVVPNNRLLSVLDRNTSMVEAFRVADDVLRQGVQGISDLVTLPGLINLDFADVRTIMSDAGNALLGIGLGMGDRRAIDAAEQAVSSPLLETSMDGAHSILLSITGGHDLSLWEVNEAAKAVASAAHPDANIIFGAMLDEKLEDQVWVTVVATGFGEGRSRPQREERDPASMRSEQERPASRRDDWRDDGPRDRDRDRDREPRREPLREPHGEPRVTRRRERPASTSFELDVPEFIPRR
jgi:cell division protein FtsZ